MLRIGRGKQHALGFGTGRQSGHAVSHDSRLANRDGDPIRHEDAHGTGHDHDRERGTASGCPAAAVAPALDCSTTTTTSSTSSTTSSSSTTTTSATTTTTDPATTSSTTSASGGAVATSGGSVLGERVDAAPVRAGALARTGSDVAPFLLVAVGLVLVGAVLVVARRTPRGRHQ